MTNRSKYDENDEEHKDPRNCLKNCTYLEDSMVELYGIKIYGTPWQENS